MGRKVLASVVLAHPEGYDLMVIRGGLAVG